MPTYGALTTSAILFSSIIFNGALSAPLSVSDKLSATNSTVFECAYPHRGDQALVKRAKPTIGEGIDVNDPWGGAALLPSKGWPTSGGFADALHIMDLAINVPRAKPDAIFEKYFNKDDKEVVTNVFRRLLGENVTEGAAALANIKIVDNSKRDIGTAIAVTVLIDAGENPTLILSKGGL